MPLHEGKMAEERKQQRRQGSRRGGARGTRGITTAHGVRIAEDDFVTMEQLLQELDLMAPRQPHTSTPVASGRHRAAQHREETDDEAFGDSQPPRQPRPRRRDQQYGQRMLQPPPEPRHLLYGERLQARMPPVDVLDETTLPGGLGSVPPRLQPSPPLTELQELRRRREEAEADAKAYAEAEAAAKAYAEAKAAASTSFETPQIDLSLEQGDRFITKRSKQRVTALERARKKAERAKKKVEKIQKRKKDADKEKEPFERLRTVR